MQEMDVFSLLSLAVVQGLTEFLPISSSAHLILFSYFMEIKDPGLVIDIALHAGTLCALLWYFRRDLKSFCTLAAISNPQRRRRWMQLIVATIPVICTGFLLKSWIETAGRTPLYIALSSIIFGLLLGWALWKHSTYKHYLSDESMPWIYAIAIGAAQAVAVIPGVSRSGITLTAALALGLMPQAAARFSFYLSIPVIVGANALSLYSHSGLFLGLGQDQLFLIVTGIVVSGIVGYGAIHLLYQLLLMKRLWIFVLYRLLLGVCLFIMLK
jgi:undecaprenyl-diphosphatase